MIETMRKRIAEYSHCFLHSMEKYNVPESDSSLGASKPEVTLYDDFKPTYLVASNLNDDMPLPSLELENGLPMSLSYGLSPKPSSHNDVSDDVLIYADPPSPFNDSFEFEVGVDVENANELDMSITIGVEHHDVDEFKDISLQE